MSLKRAALLLGLVSSYSFAMDSTSVIKEVVVSKTDNSVLSIQNLSSTELLIDIYGKEFTIEPASGLSFECEGYSDLEIQLKNVVHDYFEVPCKSRVVFSENFNVQDLMKWDVYY